MKQFIKGILTDSDGNPSSKRVVMFLLTFLFIGISIANVAAGKDLESTLKSQLFYLLCWMFSVVFGEKVVNIFTPKGGKKSTENSDSK
jgi:hypothetical protein